MSTAESSLDVSYCGHCGQADGGSDSNHERCLERLRMEPPRYCTACSRRLKVQVTPVGWSAECSRHGATHS